MSFAHSIDYSYDTVGNFTRKTDYSLDSADAYQYVSNTNRVRSVELASRGTVEFGYDNKGNQTHRNNIQEITYNTFNKPTAINRLGSSVALYYGSDLMRYKQVRNVNGKTTTTYYINKLFEVEHADNKVTERSYISDIAILEESESNYSITFTHRDRLGSAVTFTDHNGKIVAFRSFDPFGKPKMGDGSLISSMGMRARLSNNMTDIAQATRKGFTDHEHLDEVELIHMNGRVYDYNLGRFLSVDPFIQGVGNSQGINPYSYVMNNPLGYTDPTGYSAVETEEVKKVSTGSRIAKRTGETKQTATVTSNGVSTTVTKTTKSNGSSSYTSTSNGGGRSKTLTGDIGSQQQIAKNDSTNENPNGTFYFGGAGLNGDYISGMKDALEEAGISGVTTIGPEGLSGGAIVDAAIGYLALNEKMEGFPHSLGLPDSGSEQFNMIGYSFGSLLAAQYSAKYADAGFKVDNLVLVGSPISKKFLTELQGHKNIRNIKVKDLTSHGDPIRAGMSVGNPIKAYNLITTLGSQDEQRNGSGHFYYRCTNCGATGQQRRKQLAQELYDGGLR